MAAFLPRRCLVPVVLGGQPLGCLLTPGLLGQRSKAVTGETAELNLQPQEAPPCVLPPDSRTGGGGGRRRSVRLRLADAEHGRCLALTQPYNRGSPWKPASEEGRRCGVRDNCNP